MVTGKKQSTARRKFISKQDKALKKRVARAERDLYNNVLSIYSSVKTDEDGSIKKTASNYNKLNQISTVYQAFTQKTTSAIGQWLVKQSSKLLNLSTKYFKKITVFDNDVVEGKVRKNLLAELGYDIQKKAFIKGRWLDNLVKGGGVSDSIGALLNDAIAAKMNLKQFISNVKNVISPAGGGGVLTRHFNTFTRDFFNRVDRSIGKGYADQLELNFAIWGGTLKKNSRQICEDNVNKVFTRKELIAIGETSWPEKKKVHNIFLDLGGYNCRHQLDWVSDEVGKLLFLQQRGVEYKEAA